MNQSDNRYPPGGFYHLSPYEIRENRKPLRRWSNRIALGLLMVHVISSILYMIVGAAYTAPVIAEMSDNMFALLDEVVYLVVYVLMLWLPTLFILSSIGIPVVHAFPLKRPQLSIAVPAVFVCLGASVLGSVIVTILSVYMESVFGLVPTMPDFSLPQGVAANAVYVVRMSVLPAVFEELLFRGVILQSLRRFGDGFALVASSILFGLLHGNLVQGPNAILLGLVIGYFVLRTGSVLTGMLMHFINNFLVVVFGYLSMDMAMEQIVVLDLAVYGTYAVTCVIAIVYLVVRHGNLFRVPRSDYPLPAGKKYTAFFSAAAVIVFIAVTVLITSVYFERPYY